MPLTQFKTEPPSTKPSHLYFIPGCAETSHHGGCSLCWGGLHHQIQDPKGGSTAPNECPGGGQDGIHPAAG